MTHDLEIITEAKAALSKGQAQSASTLVHLGLEYWAQCSVPEALKIIERREKVMQDKQEQIQQGLQHLNHKSAVVSQLTGTSDPGQEGAVMDIREAWSDTSLSGTQTVEPIKKRVAHSASSPPSQTSSSVGSSTERAKDMKELERIFDAFEAEERHLSSKAVTKEPALHMTQQKGKKVTFLSPLTSPTLSSSSSMSDGMQPPLESSASDADSSDSSHDLESEEHSTDSSIDDNDSDQAHGENDEKEAKVTQNDHRHRSDNDSALSPSVLMQQVAREYERKRKSRPAMVSNIQLQIQPMNTSHSEDLVESLQTALGDMEMEEKHSALDEPSKPTMSRFKAERKSLQVSPSEATRSETTLPFSNVYHPHSS